MLILIKYGGHAMENPDIAVSFARSIKDLKNTGHSLVLTHGGGPHINAMLEKLNITSTFKNGLRVTDKATMEVVEMVLSGSLNSQLVGLFTEAGIKTVGLSAKDSKILSAKALAELGLVGEVTEVNVDLIKILLENNFLPLIAPIAYGENGTSLNVNADTASGAIAGALNADAFVLVTDVQGVLDKSGNLLQKLTFSEIETLKSDGTITGGMIPKVDSCLNALNKGCKKAYILDSTKAEHIEKLLFHGEAFGTLIEA